MKRCSRIDRGCKNELPDDSRYRQCERCRARVRSASSDKYAQYKAKGICPECGEAWKGKQVLCQTCRGRRKELVADRKRSGLCSVANCNEKPLSCDFNAPLCEYHWLKKVSLKHKVSVEILKALWLEQGGRSRYSGTILVMGSVNRDKQASLDHKTPLSKGGTNDKDNLQWITYRENTMKGDLTEAEYFALIKHQFNYFGANDE